MTKSEKERLKQECEMGLHAASYEVLLKAELRKERRLEKRRKTLAMNAQKELLAENERLKAEVSRLDLLTKTLMAENASYQAALAKLAKERR